MRMFVAVVPPEDVLEDLEEFIEPRRESGPWRWTSSQQWHVTLAFMDDVPERAYDDLLDRLTRAARKRAPMTARITGGGAFPNAARARVLYAGLDTDRIGLGHLATGARAAAAKAGAAVDGQRFTPHLTLGRVNRPVEATRWVRLLDAYSGPSWQVEDITLVASYLGEGPRNRARHEIVGIFPLSRHHDPSRSH